MEYTPTERDGKRVWALDWAYEAKKFILYDGHKGRIYTGETSLPKFTSRDVIVCENIPDRLAIPLIQAGVTILRCDTQAVKETRQKFGWEKRKGKGDDLDAIILWNIYNERPDLFRPYWGTPRLRILANTYRELVKDGVRLKNRMWHRGNDPIFKALLELNEEQKKKLLKELRAELRKLPVWNEWLQHIFGVGPALGGILIGYLGEIADRDGRFRMKPFRTPSSIWRYLGLHVEDGRAARLKKGTAASWQQGLKPVLLHDFGQQIIRRNSEYRPVYEAAKEKKLAEGWPKGRAFRHGVRKAVKRFLADLWVVWRVLDALEDGLTPDAIAQLIRMPYAIEYGGHSTYELPPRCPDRVAEVLLYCVDHWSKRLGRHIKVSYCTVGIHDGGASRGNSENHDTRASCILVGNQQ